MSIERRAELHAALADPVRLAVIDELHRSDRSPGELVARLGIGPSLLAFHLDTLERVGLVERIVSSGDRRRKYVRLVGDELTTLRVEPPRTPGPVIFVCTRNSARSQLAAALWRAERGPATSAGTDPADHVAPGAVGAARRAGLDLGDATPRLLEPGDLDHRVITVCDRAHEHLPAEVPHWHWSIPDPIAIGTDVAFDRALALIRTRITSLALQERT